MIHILYSQKDTQGIEKLHKSSSRERDRHKEVESTGDTHVMTSMPYQESNPVLSVTATSATNHACWGDVYCCTKSSIFIQTIKDCRHTHFISLLSHQEHLSILKPGWHDGILKVVKNYVDLNGYRVSQVLHNFNLKIYFKYPLCSMILNS